MPIDRAAAARFIQSDEFKNLSPEQQQAVVSRMKQEFAQPSPPPEKPDPQPAQSTSFSNDVISRIGQNIAGLMRAPEKFIQSAKPSGNESLKDRILKPLNAEENQITDFLKGVMGVTTPALLTQPSEKSAADAATFMLGDIAGGEPARGLQEAAAKPLADAASKAASPARILFQEVAGAGKEPIYEAAMKRAKDVSRKVLEHNSRAEDIARENADALQVHKVKTQEAIDSYLADAKKASEEYQQKLNDYRNAEDAKKAEHLEKVGKARQEWIDKTRAARSVQAQADAVAAQRETLSKSRDAISKRLAENIRDVHAKVRQALNSRWDKLRETMGVHQVDAPPIYKAIQQSRSMLQGVPEDLKVFNDIVGQITEEKSVVDKGGFEPDVPKPSIDWEAARTHFSALGEKVFSADGNLRRALRNVYDAYDTQLGKAAADAGQGKVYSALKKDWSQYMHDWHDTSAVSGGGSTLARTLKAPNGFIPQLVSGKGEFLREFGRYKEFGASTSLGEAIRTINDRAKSLKTPTVPKAPGKFSAPDAPRPGREPSSPEAKPFKSPEPPRLKTQRPLQIPPDIDPVEIRKRILLRKAGRPFGWLDMIPGYQIEHLALKNKAFRDWVASQPRKELPIE